MTEPDAARSLGNGSFELSDIPEAAGKLADGASRQLREAEIALLLELRPQPGDDEVHAAVVELCDDEAESLGIERAIGCDNAAKG